MSVGLLAVVDDILSAAMKASAKTAGVVIDDADFDHGFGFQKMGFCIITTKLSYLTYLETPCTGRLLNNLFVTCLWEC